MDLPSSDAPNRAGGRSSRREKRKLHVPPMLPTLENRLPLTAPMDEEQIARIDDASMSILEDVGVAFRDPIALDDWRKVGARIDGELVKFDREHIRSLISSIPETITLHARNPENTIGLGGRKSIFVPMTGAPYLRDLDDERR